MRYLADANPRGATPIVLVPMRGKHDCLTCVAAMLLGMSYDQVESAFGGNIDPSKDREKEAERLQWAFQNLIEQHNRYVLHLSTLPDIRAGRRYWVAVRIDDPGNPLSKIMTHSVAVDETRRVFDPNPSYGQFESFEEWRAAITLPHEVEFASEIFEFST